MPYDASQTKVLAEQYSDQLWRLNNLYWIQDKEGKKVLFQLNWAQQRLFDEMDYLNAILKARQFGFTTFIDVFSLDTCIFNGNTKAGIIAHNLDDAKKIFRSKIQFPFKHLPEAIQAAVKPDNSRSNEYVFSNGSEISVSTSYRSGTLQILHVSEYGKIAAKYPHKAKEINTGAIEAVAQGQMIFIESTAEGRGGEFYELIHTAKALHDAGKPITPMDFKYHFYPWWENPEYAMSPKGVSFPQDAIEYFKTLDESFGIKLSREQQAWYIKKKARLKDDMKREYPSTHEEAFESAIDGSYYGRIISKLRTLNRITKVPYEPLLPVHTFWDLGFNDKNAIWFYQQRGMERRLIDYYENTGEGLAHYKRVCQDKKYVYGTHYLPHDGRNGSIQTGKRTEDIARSIGFNPLTVVPRAKNQEEVLAGIENVRNFLLTCWIDEEKCEKGIKALEGYRKEWDENYGVFKRTPAHTDESNGADSLRTGAVGLSANTSLTGSDLTPEDVAEY